MNYSEEVLIRMMQSADSNEVRAAFERLYVRNFGRMYSTARGYFKNADIAENLVYQTFLEIFENRHRLESARDVQRYYVRSIRQTAMKHMRPSAPGKYRDHTRTLDERLHAIRSEIQRESNSLDTLLQFDILFPPVAAESRESRDVYCPDEFDAVHQSLLYKVRQNPDLLHKLSGWEFEQLVAELFREAGYEVTLTPRTCDGGKDIVVVERRLIGDFTYYIECKRYARGKKISVSVVRALHGVVEAEGATAGIIITTADFSKKARAFADSIKSQMSLLDHAVVDGLLSRRLKLSEIIGLNNN